MTNLKQPALGITATFAMIALSLGFISLFTFPTFSGWVTFYMISIIPTQIVIGVIWGTNYPRFVAQRRQPAKGLLLTVVILLGGAVVAGAHFAVAGAGINPPPPMATMTLIVSVIVAFWAAIMFGGWPFTSLFKNPVAAGTALLAACYVFNYLQCRILMDFGFMRGAPVYVASLDPHGPFNAWSFLVYELTACAFMFLMLHFDLWPLSKWPRLMKQPLLGIVWTAICLALGALAFFIGTILMRMDTVDFMVWVPIPFIFGTIFVLNMLQGSLFAKMTQPLRGVMSTAGGVVLGLVLAEMFKAVEPFVSGALKLGPPGYDAEIWLASALLGVTFPFLVMFAELFGFWPLRATKKDEALAAAGGGQA